MQGLPRLLAVGLVVLVAAGPLGAPAAAQRDKKAAKTTLVQGPVRLVPAAPQPSAISGLGAYFGQIKLTPASDGLVVVNRLPLERYLLGLAEVPVDWPVEALKAQAIAARTYALNTLARPPAGAAVTYGFDICATVECQVFSGAAVLQQSDGRRWADAVEATAGRAILYDGGPILARYHSVSGGKTFDNEQIFPSEGAFPYLKGVRSEPEDASPLDRWSVAFVLDDLQTILERAGRWSSDEGRLQSVHTVASNQDLHYPDVVLRGGRGRIRMTAEDLRVIVRELAPEIFSGKYPSVSLAVAGRLPETFPSNRLTIRTQEGVARVVGRGWGHGVGMSQWGAHGMATDGATHEQILNHYYTGVTLGRIRDPGALDVGIDWGRSAVEVTGAFKVVDERGRTVVDEAVGGWTFRYMGTGSLSVTPPKGGNAPLSVRLLRSPDEIGVGEAAFLTIGLSRPARVVPVTSDGSSLEEAGTIREAGRAKVPWLAPLTPGRYSVHVEASSGSEKKRSEAVEIVVTGAEEDELEAGPDSARAEESAADAGEAAAPWGLLLFALLFAAAGIFVVTVTMKR